MEADRNPLVLSFHPATPYEYKMNLKCNLGRVLQTLSMGVNDYRGWVLAANRRQQLLNSFFPFCLPGYQGMNWDTSVSPSPVEMSSLIHGLLSVTELVTLPALDLYFVSVSVFGALQMCCTV